MKLVQNVDKGPDHYDVILDNKCTVGDAVNMILEDKESWGCIIVTSGRRYKFENCPQYKYHRGNLKHEMPEELTELDVCNIKAIGLRPHFTYIIHVKKMDKNIRLATNSNGTNVGLKDYEKDEVWKHSIIAAKELCYPRYVIDALKAEPDPNNRNRILKNARLREERR